MKKIYVFDSESGKVVERKKPNFIEIPEVENELIEKVFGKFFVEMFCSKSTFDLEFVTVLQYWEDLAMKVQWALSRRGCKRHTEDHCSGERRCRRRFL
jgi:hypothetical protein